MKITPLLIFIIIIGILFLLMLAALFFIWGGRLPI